MFIIDIETEKTSQEANGWNDPFSMGFGTAVVYCYDNDIYYFFNKNEKKKFKKLLKNEIVISFNGIRFDNRVVEKNGNVTWKDIDLLEEVIRSKYKVDNIEEAVEIYGKNIVHNNTINLNGLSYGTLEKEKNGKGKLAPILIQNKKWSKVFEYNLHDVRLTRQLFEYALQHGYVKDREGTIIYLNMYKIIEKVKQ